MSLSVLPGQLDHAVANWLQDQDGTARRAQSGRLTQVYKAGQSSARVDLAAYLTTRMPATFAAVRRVMGEVASINPDFLPNSILDIGAGPGTGSWAALSIWPELATISMIEMDARFVELADALAKASELRALSNATITRAKMSEAEGKAALVVAAYVIAELAEKDAGVAALKLWAQTEHTLIIIEPGTPRGFARIKAVRGELIKAGAHIIGPCTHANACPMGVNEWCRFTQRLARSREHMHAKQATVPFEDESFSWIAVSRCSTKLAEARVVAPPEYDKHSITLKLCNEQGIVNRMIARRDKAAYKQHRKIAWGDVV